MANWRQIGLRGGVCVWLAACVAAVNCLPGPGLAAGVLTVNAPALAVRLGQGEAIAHAAPSARPKTATPATAATPAPSATPAPTPPPNEAPADLENAGAIRAVSYAQGSGSGYLLLPFGSIRNMTTQPNAVLGSAVKGELPFTVEPDSDEPQILILHTHATETYQSWDELVFDPDFTARTTDTARNMCAVGEKMAEVLNGAGIRTLHDTTLHDSPSYTESYARSAATTKAYLKKYPSIKIVLDVHRDAIEDADGTRVKPVCEIDGQQAAQVMIIAGCDNGANVCLPNWKKNLNFAAAWEQAMERETPGLTRPVLCGYRYYNQDLTMGSLLIEVGGHANTLEEAVLAGEKAARALAVLLGERAE